MDFSRSIKNRAKLIDKNLDKIVPMPEEYVVNKPSSKHIRKPLFITLGSALACAAVAVAAVTLSLKKPTNTGVIDDPVEKLPFNPEKYRTQEFPFSEYAYYSYYADTNNRKESEALDINRTSFKAPSEVETISNPNNGKSVDENNRIHYPLDVRKYYTFSDFYYFEFESKDCPLLESTIGNGTIQGLTVCCDCFYGEGMIILKNEDRFFSCLSISSYRRGTDLNELIFSSYKYIEEWELIKDFSQEKVEIRFNFDDYYPASRSLTIGSQTFKIDVSKSTYSGEVCKVGVNEVRAYLGLPYDPRFPDIAKILPEEIDIQNVDEINLPELHDGVNFKIETIGEGEDKKLKLVSRDKTYTLDGYCFDCPRKSVFLCDFTGDGIRDLVYLAKNLHNGYHVEIIDLDWGLKYIENIKNREFDIWFEINGKELKPYIYGFDPEINEERVYDYGDLTIGAYYELSIRITWNNLYRSKDVGLLELNGDSFSIYDLKLKTNEVYVIKMQINYENDAAFIPDVDPVLAAFSSVLCRGTEQIWLEASFVRKEDNKYCFAFSISEPGIYDVEFMVDDYVITIFGVVVE